MKRADKSPHRHDPLPRGGPASAKAGAVRSLPRLGVQLSKLLARARGGTLHQVVAFHRAQALGFAHACQHARGQRNRLLQVAAVGEDEEAAPRAHVGQADFLPLVLQQHLVGEADAQVVHQARAVRRLGRVGRHQVEVDVDPEVQRRAVDHRRLVAE